MIHDVTRARCWLNENPIWLKNEYDRSIQMRTGSVWQRVTHNRSIEQGRAKQGVSQEGFELVEPNLLALRRTRTRDVLESMSRHRDASKSPAWLRVFGNLKLAYLSVGCSIFIDFFTISWISRCFTLGQLSVIWTSASVPICTWEATTHNISWYWHIPQSAELKLECWIALKFCIDSVPNNWVSIQLTGFRVRSHMCDHLNYWLRCRPKISRDIAIQIE